MKERKKTNLRLDRNVAQISLAHSMNARKGGHAQNPYSFQSFAMNQTKSEGEKKRDREDRGQETEQNKELSEELKQPLPRHNSLQRCCRVGLSYSDAFHLAARQ